METSQDRRETDAESSAGLFERVPIGLYRTTPSGEISDVNRALLDMLGYSDKASLMAEDAASVYADTTTRNRWLAEMEAEGVVSGFVSKWRGRDGSLIWVKENAQTVLDDAGSIAFYEGSAEDITAQKEAEAAVASSSRKFEELHGAADALGKAETEDEVCHVTCEAAERALGFPLGILCIAEGDDFVCRAVSSKIDEGKLGSTKIGLPGLAVSALKEGQPIIVNDPMPNSLPRGIPATCRSLICAPIGNIGVFQAGAFERAAFSEEDGRLLAILLRHAAVAVLRLRLQQQLIEQARRDPLTGVLNRHYFNELIAQEVLRSSRYDHPIGLLMIDVDRFKEINDRYGHQVGDMVLREIASVLRGTVRRTDMLIRYGGDEFLVILTETGEETEHAALRVRRAVASSAKLRQISGFGVTVSVGSIFWHPEAGTPIESALAEADSRMYAEKRRR